jgi:hypothetical protein
MARYLRVTQQKQECPNSHARFWEILRLINAYYIEMALLATVGKDTHERDATWPDRT